MSLAIWSLADKCFIVPFGPWRDKMFHCTFWPLAAQNVPLYLLVPGGIKCFHCTVWSLAAQCPYQENGLPKHQPPANYNGFRLFNFIP